MDNESQEAWALPIVGVDKHFTVDEVVFAEKGDLLSWGAHVGGTESYR